MPEQGDFGGANPRVMRETDLLDLTRTLAVLDIDRCADPHAEPTLERFADPYWKVRRANRAWCHQAEEFDAEVNRLTA